MDDDDATWMTTSERHHEVEVALVASSLSSPEERTLAVTYLERDPTKRERRVRAATGPQAGRRVRLRVPRGHSPMTVPSILPGPARDPLQLEEEKAAQQMLRIRVGGLTLLSKISPPLPTSCRPDDPPLERQFGTLRANGIAVQLRFAPCVAVVENAQSASTSASGQPPQSSPPPSSRSDDGSSSSSSSSSGPAPASYKLLDGAFTADHLATDGRAALAAAGAAVATAARDALLVLPAPAPRAGRSPEVGSPVDDASEEEHAVDRERALVLGVIARLLAYVDRVEHYSTSCAPVMKREYLVPESVI